MVSDLVNTVGLGVPMVAIGILAIWHSVKLIGVDPGTGFKKLTLKSYKTFGIINIIMGILFIIAGLFGKDH